ncbi:DUF1194 domain-containing protein [Rhodoplanes sp. TEM]|uniref:DUF1194 domain-containing protein n=1 Tax=Rhodoplanes tepidamans TaxID=200616 RepID=A0ABT5JF87_RHOTP|nr:MULTISPECIES: DUF1194 domain-containing protein [Rhodoplanes]MDC7788227.1 DUF1194 domain-containing protein [Rhodoplanes tepidamans]MDC7982968.1 DUF1194 domain-containing protein [Rhodoplanes sp. TEM]MDQ0355905.1 hypothetical protein [Rhodoplanes tepidamans]
MRGIWMRGFSLRGVIRAGLGILVLAVGMLGATASRAAEEVDLLLALAADVSRSVDGQKFQLQRDGYAAALQDPRVVAAITGGTLGRIAVAYIEWSGAGNQKTVIDWTVIRDADSAGRFATQLLESPRAFADRTSISGGIDFAAAQFDRAPFPARRRTIDVSGDGTNNSGREVTAARDEAIAKGIAINGLVILTEQPLSWNAEHTNPAGGLDAYFRNNVIGGPGAFVITAQDFAAFGQALISKLVAEIAAASPPSRAAGLR